MLQYRLPNLGHLKFPVLYHCDRISEQREKFLIFHENGTNVTDFKNEVEYFLQIGQVFDRSSKCYKYDRFCDWSPKFYKCDIFWEKTHLFLKNPQNVTNILLLGIMEIDEKMSFPFYNEILIFFEILNP